MEIPRYILDSIHSHLRRITANATCDPADHRTADALRLAHKDLRNLEKICAKTNTITKK